MIQDNDTGVLKAPYNSSVDLYEIPNTRLCVYSQANNGKQYRIEVTSLFNTMTNVSGILFSRYGIFGIRFYFDDQKHTVSNSYQWLKPIIFSDSESIDQYFTISTTEDTVTINSLKAWDNIRIILSCNSYIRIGSYMVTE